MHAEDPSARASAAPDIGIALLEVGFVFDRRLDSVDREGSRAAVAELKKDFQQLLPQFEWRLPIVERDVGPGIGGQTAVLLELGAAELAVYHWDFAVVVSALDLEAFQRSHAFAATSRALGVAVLSTIRLDPLARRESVADAERRAVIRRRVQTLATALLGHLGGLSPRPGTAMVSPSDESDLDEALSFTPTQIAELADEWARVADRRLEEERERIHPLPFYLRACWRNRRELVATLWRSRPWELPFRLGRLTTAAISALAIVMLTAESWDVGVRLGDGVEAVLAVGSVSATALYVLRRQRLLSPVVTARPTEQSVIARVSVTIFVLIGMAVTYGALAAIGFWAGCSLFPTEVIARWTGVPATDLGHWVYFRQALFVATLSSVVGALGVSFEGQAYVKHIAYVDREF